MGKYVEWSLYKSTFEILNLAKATNTHQRDIRTAMQLIDLQPQDSELFCCKNSWHKIFPYWDCVQIMLIARSKLSLKINIDELIDKAQHVVEEESYRSYMLTLPELESLIMNEILFRSRASESICELTLREFSYRSSVVFFQLDNYIQAEIGGSHMRNKIARITGG